MDYVVRKFGANWCMPCKTLDAKLKDFNECEVIKYNVDETDENLLEKYQVQSIPVTVLENSDGDIIERWVGVFNVDVLAKKVKQLKENDKVL